MALDISGLLALGAGPPGLTGDLPETPTDQRDAPGDETEPIQILADMIAKAKRYMEVEPDQEDVATMAKVLQTLQQYLAKDQRDRDVALSGGPATRILRKLPAA